MAVKIFSAYSVGVDEFRQGIPSSPYGDLGQSIGLRVPQFIQGAGNFLFLCATVVVPPGGIRLVSIKRLAMIGAVFQAPTGQSVLLEKQITTPGFAFPDGGISWHLVLEPNLHKLVQRPLTDSINFCATEANGPALLYEPGSVTFAPGTFDPLTGAPAVYSNGMLTYQPPTNVIQDWNDIGGVKSYLDNTDALFPSGVTLPIDASMTMRLSLYCMVDQTNPVTCPLPANLPASSDLPPEWSYMITHQFAAEGNVCSGVFYSRVGGLIEIDRNYPSSDLLTTGNAATALKGK